MPTRNCATKLNHTGTLNRKYTTPLVPQNTTGVVHIGCRQFWCKICGNEHANHLIACLKQSKYKLTEDWTGCLYCGTTLDWNYKAGYVDISMPRYTKKKLHEYGHVCPNRLQTCPYSAKPKTYGAKAQAHLTTPNHLTRKEYSKFKKL